MKTLRPLLIGLLIAALMGGASALVAARLGETPIAVHFGVNGPDRFAPARSAVWFLPGVAVVFSLLFAGLPQIMPRNSDLTRSNRAYQAAWLAIMLLLAVTHAAILAAGLGWAIEPTRLVSGAVGVLLIVLGNLMGKIRYNYVFGIRTPWTLSSERVWDKTHRFVGPWFAAWGAGVVLGALFAPSEFMGVKLLPVLMAGGAFAVVGLALVYSYLASRKIGAT